MHKKEYSADVGGKTLTAIFSDLANQAHGSVILRYGNSAVLATVVMSEKTKEEAGYFPLTVDYEEKFYAAGAILGSRFMRREGRPTDEAILSGRVVDRTIRPLFDQHIRNEVQVVITILSIDEDDPDVLAVIASSLALGTSDIPWNGPVSATRIGNIAGTYLINPTYAERARIDNKFDLLICGKDGSINMIEVGAREVEEKALLDALQKGVDVISTIQAFQEKIIKDIGKEKRTLPQRAESKELVALFEKECAPRLESALFNGPGKQLIYELKDVWLKAARMALPEENERNAESYFEDAVSNAIHNAALEQKKRADGRAMDEIRPLFAQAGGVSEIIHGTGIFYRGGTHILSALTLGGPGDSQIIDNMEARDTEKHFMHHYNFPPFSTGETGRIGGANRRMIGHGALAEKALLPVIPTQDEFPYTIRLVSEAMASNGSTSMGSVCASTLALMDGGVPIKKPVAGIAMGLMLGEGGAYRVLTDIQGPEDEHGDMDLKVAGTKDGVTAVQMDVKVHGVSIAILKEAFADAQKARVKILQCLAEAIPKPREFISPRAPKIIVLSIKEDQIGLVIGPGGKTINSIKETTGVEEITIQDNGTVYITGKKGVEEARKIIEGMTREYKVGERFEGVITRILDFGAFVRIGYNTEGLVHISELAPFRVNRVEDVVSVGEAVPVIIKEIDGQGRINLSIKRADPEFASKKGTGQESTRA